MRRSNGLPFESRFCLKDRREALQTARAGSAVLQSPSADAWFLSCSFLAPAAPLHLSTASFLQRVLDLVGDGTAANHPEQPTLGRDSKHAQHYECRKRGQMGREVLALPAVQEVRKNRLAVWRTGARIASHSAYPL